MCGICGLFKNSKSIDFSDIASVKTMVDELYHRGPDAQNAIVHKNVIFGHTRLKIIDISNKSNQPVVNSSKSMLIFNGEIYNYRKIRTQLVKEGYKFKSKGDAEVLLVLYEKYGINFVEKINGMFAIAIYDAYRNEVLLIRDRYGIKPLYYQISKTGDIYFSSEIRPLTMIDNFSGDISYQALSEYLWYGNSYEDRSIYKNIKQLNPGTYATIKTGKISFKRYFKVENFLDNSISKGKYNFQELESLVDNASSSHMLSDVPVSLLLSSGIDSSTIACSLLKRHKNLKSYTISFGSSPFDESFAASDFAKNLGLKNEIVNFTESEIHEATEKLPFFFGEPFADAANIPLYLVSKKMSLEDKVIIQGDGGDEFFGGYDRYRYIKLLHFGFLKSFLQKFPYKKNSRINRILSAFNSSEEMIMALLLTRETVDNSPTKLLSKDFEKFLNSKTDPFLTYRNCNNRFSQYSLIERMMLTDITTQLPNQFLSKVDRSTMANSKESRVPFLDEDLSKYALNLSPKKKVGFAYGKIQLRNLIKNTKCPSLYKKQKQGFGTPYEMWMRTVLRDMTQDYLLSDSFINSFNISKTQMINKINIFFNNRGGGFTIWKYFQLALWNEKRQVKK